MITKLQVPMDKDVRDNLEKRARSLGFDSAQAYIRVWAKAEADGRKLDFDGVAVTLSALADKRYIKAVKELDSDNKLPTFTSADEFMKDLK